VVVVELNPGPVVGVAQPAMVLWICCTVNRVMRDKDLGSKRFGLSPASNPSRSPACHTLRPYVFYAAIRDVTAHGRGEGEYISASDARFCE